MSVECSVDPRTGAPATSAPATNTARLVEKIGRAQRATGVAACSSPATRAAWLGAAANALQSHRVELARLADWETARGREYLLEEVSRAAEQIRLGADMAVEGSRLDVQIDDRPSGERSGVHLNESRGVVAVVGSSDFPFAFGVFGNDSALAIAVGSAVIAKVNSLHLGVSDKIFEVVSHAMRDAGAPPDLLQIVHGDEVGAAMEKHPAIAIVVRAGSDHLQDVANETTA